jgi:hypothetical protein
MCCAAPLGQPSQIDLRVHHRGWPNLAMPGRLRYRVAVGIETFPGRLSV